jgi:hypothetical protein
MGEVETLLCRGAKCEEKSELSPTTPRNQRALRGVVLSGELPRPTALGPTRPSLVEVGASCFCVGTCIRGGHSGSRLRRRFPFTGGSECPTPTGWTLDHNRLCALLVALEHRRRRGEHRTTLSDHRSSKPVEVYGNNRRRRCIPTLLRSLRSLRGGRGLSACIPGKSRRQRNS